METLKIQLPSEKIVLDQVSEEFSVFFKVEKLKNPSEVDLKQYS